MEHIHAYRFITRLCKECYMQPKVVSDLMRISFEDTLKYQTKLWSRITIERLLKKHIGTNYVQSIGYNQLKRTNDIHVFEECIEVNMNIVKKSSVREEKMARNNMIQSKIRLKKVVNMNTLAGEEFLNLVDKQWKYHWIKHKEKSYNKIKTLEEKQVKRLENSTKSTMKKNDKKHAQKGLDNLANSVKYKDKDIAHINYDNKPKTLEFADINKNMGKVLGKHPGYTVYKTIEEDDIDLSVEECIQKGRWKNSDIVKEASEEEPNNDICNQIKK